MALRNQSTAPYHVSARSGAAPKRKPRREAGCASEGQFPPLSTSLEVFLTSGSDAEFRRLIYGVLTVSALMLRSRERFGAFIGVSAPQYSMMVAIAEANESTVTQLAEQLHVSAPFVTAEVGKLINKGIVQRRPNAADGRSLLLTLTAKGEDLIRHLGPYRRMANDMIFGSLTREQAAEFRRIIEVLLGDAEKALHELGNPAWTSLAVPHSSRSEGRTKVAARPKRRKA